MAMYRYTSRCSNCGNMSNVSKLIEGDNFTSANKDVPAYVTYYCSNCRIEHTDIFDLEKYNFIIGNRKSKVESSKGFVGLINKIKLLKK